MKKRFNYLFLELKIFGGAIIIPIIFLVLSSLNLINHDFSKGLSYEIANSFDIFLPLIAAFLIIFLFKDQIDEDGNDLIFSLYNNRFRMGFLRFLFGIMAYSIIILIYTLLLTILFKDLSIIALFVKLIVQGIFLASLSFLLMIVINSSHLVITSVITYTIILKMSPITILNFMSIYNYNLVSVNLYDIIENSIIPIIISCCFIIIAQSLFNRFHNFK